MGELITRVMGVLQTLNLSCRSAFPPARLPMLTAPLYIVRLESEKRTSMVLGDYFGLSGGAACYGQAVTTVICVDVFAPCSMGGAACNTALQSTAAALSTQLTDDGLSEIRLEPLHFDTDTDYLRSTIYLTFRGCLYRKVSS